MCAVRLKMRAAKRLGRNLRVAARNMGREIIAVAIEALGHKDRIITESRR